MTHHKRLDETALGGKRDRKKRCDLIYPNTNRASPTNHSRGTHTFPLSDGRDLVGLEELKDTLAMVCVVETLCLAMGTGHFR
jgi:hypothetical protein